MTSGFMYGGKDFEQTFITMQDIYPDAGGLWLWGGNGNSQLGDSTLSSCSSPVQTISGGTTWSQIACGYYHTAAIKIV